jgi:formylglycine-generating enzyme required for sulfatase activity
VSAQTVFGPTIKANDGYVFTAPVGKFKPNAFGLYDMHGNATQWCADWYAANYYAKSPVDDPKGPDFGDNHVRRGGNWACSVIGDRSAARASDRRNPNRLFGTGFRVAMTP